MGSLDSAGLLAGAIRLDDYVYHYHNDPDYSGRPDRMIGGILSRLSDPGHLGGGAVLQGTT